MSLGLLKGEPKEECSLENSLLLISPWQIRSMGPLVVGINFTLSLKSHRCLADQCPPGELAEPPPVGGPAARHKQTAIHIPTVHLFHLPKHGYSALYQAA